MKAFAALMAGILVLNPHTYAGGQNKKADHWENYQPRTLQSIIDMHPLEDLDHDSKKKAMCKR